MIQQLIETDKVFDLISYTLAHTCVKFRHLKSILVEVMSKSIGQLVTYHLKVTLFLKTIL